MGKGSGVLDAIKKSSEDGLILNNNDVQYIWDVRPKDSGSGWIETISRGESFSVSKPVSLCTINGVLKKILWLTGFYLGHGQGESQIPKLLQLRTGHNLRPKSR